MTFQRDGRMPTLLPSAGATCAISAIGRSDNVKAFERIAQIAGSDEGRVALQRKRTGQSLTPRQQDLIDEHDYLMEENGRTARAERPLAHRIGPSRYGESLTHVPAEVLRISRLPPFEQQQAAREMRTKIMNDRNHPYFNPNHAEHKQALKTMELLYQAEITEDGSPVGGNE